MPKQTPTTPTTPTAPAGNDVVSQMKGYLQQTGYQAPPPPTPAGTNDWYSQVQSARKDTADTSMGGFGKVTGAIGEDFNTRADKVGQIENSQDNPASKMLQTIGEGAGAVTDTAGEVIKSAIKPEVMQNIGEHLAPLVEAAKNSPAGSAIISWLNGLSPETQRNLSATGSIASLLSNAAGAGAAKEGVTAGTEAALGAAKDVADTTIQPTIDATKEAITAPIKTAKAAIRSKVATGDVPLMGQNVDSQVQTSATRLADQAPLIGGGAAREATPTDIYNSYINPEKAMMGNKPQGILGDAKLPGAAGKLGDTVSDAFDQVIQQRRDAGATMGSELEKTATIPVDTKSALDKFQNELADNGAKIDSKTGELIAGNESKFSTLDENILGKYAKGLQTLGSNPTMKAVDAFVSKWPNEIKALKASTGAKFMTNAERLINNNLNGFRDTLAGAGTNAYNDARSTYSRLSGIINRGSKLLGTTDSEGNYVRDASVAKRAVQSIADGGTKDLLLNLEKETGVPLMDHAVMALQAMKDAGNPMGHSLLESLTNGAKNIAVRPQGFAEHIIHGLGSFAKNKVVGSAEEQTRAFLKSLESGAKK